MPTYGRYDIAFERGEGSYLFTTEGKRYLDFTSGVAVDAFGHCHPALVETLTAQAAKLWHCSNYFRVPGQERVSARLVELTFADTVFFCNSGAEAMEGCVKLARKYQSATGHPERYRVITFEGAFHGRTLAMLAAGGQQKHLDGFGPVVDGFDQVPLNDLKATVAAIGPNTAAILIEPIQGEGGVRAADLDFLRALRQLADKHGLLLIFDEIQAGMGRTGRLFSHEWAGIVPDVMGIAKGLGGGFPVGAFLATERAAVGMTAGTHGCTFGGNPLAMAVAEKVLDLMLAPGFLAHVERMAAILKSGLEGLAVAHPEVIAEVRGVGLLAGLKCVVPYGDMVKALQDRRLLAAPAGDNVVRLLPPLTVTEDQIDEALAALHQACSDLA